MPESMSLLFKVETLLFLLAVATVSAIVLKKLRIPYTIGLVPVGIVIAALMYRFDWPKNAAELGLGKELIMYVLLPALVFDASINIDTRMLRRNLYPTLMLAGPGLVLATFVTAAVLHWAGGLGWASAMLFGALISATDPVAVISLFEIVGAPQRLRILVDGESLFNDATAIAMFNVVLKLVLASAVLTWSAAAWGAAEFGRAFLGGLIVGAIFGVAMARVMRCAGQDVQIKVGISIVLAYAAFIVADHLCGVSGVMAALASGVVLNYYGATQFTEEARRYLHEFWTLMAFLANSAIFLLLGFTEAHRLFRFAGGMPHTGGLLLAAIAAILAARAAVVFGLSPLLGRRDGGIGWRYQLVMFWGGLRGAVPLALVFSIPADYPDRDLIMQLTLGVVLFTLLVQGLSTGWLLRKLKLTDPGPVAALAEWFTLCRARNAALKLIGDQRLDRSFQPEMFARSLGEYQKKLDDALRRPDWGDPENQLALRRLIWAELMEAERRVIARYLRSGFLDEVAARRMIAGNSVLTHREGALPPPSDGRLEGIGKGRGRWLRRQWFRRCCPVGAKRILGREIGILATLLVASSWAEDELGALVAPVSGDLAAASAFREFFARRDRECRRLLEDFRQLDEALFAAARESAIRQMLHEAEWNVVETAFRQGALDDAGFDKLSAAIGKTS